MECKAQTQKYVFLEKAEISIISIEILRLDVVKLFFLTRNKNKLLDIRLHFQS
jgi:hypothetical protein